jgi:hypothetical protein
MRNHASCAVVLLEAGFDPAAKSSSGWLPLEEAACYKSRESLRMLVPRIQTAQMSKVQGKLQQLAAVLKGMPDCAFQVSFLPHFATSANASPAQAERLAVPA